MRYINNETVEGRKNIQIHVGGIYINQQGEQLITGSAGCFTLEGDNKSNAGGDAFIGEISNRIKASENAGKGNQIIINIQKRTEIPNFNQK